MSVQLNAPLFNKRLKHVIAAWNVCAIPRTAMAAPFADASLFKGAKNDDDYSSIADVDSLFLPAGDPAGEDEPIRKGIAFQVSFAYTPPPWAYFSTLMSSSEKTWLLGYEFPSTFLLFQKGILHILCSASKGSPLLLAAMFNYMTRHRQQKF